MKTLTKILVAWSLTLGVSAFAEDAMDSIKAGEKLFSINCLVCHGPKGAGDGPAASALNPKPRNLTTDPYKNGDSSAQIAATILNGLKGTAMAGFPQLSAEQRKDLAAFINSLRLKK